MTARRVAITVRGVVQGVGFRPFVFNLARGRGLSGWVRNEAAEVRIEVAGPAESVAEFLQALQGQCPPQAHIESFQVDELPSNGASESARESGFQILASPDGGTPSPTIPADLATCPACQAEIFAPAERRFRYPFTNCTNCGPRWSIIRKLPYDRPRTAMAAFAMCPDCQAEYDDPGDRRFHAQPVACPKCGPQLRLVDAFGRQQADGEDALQAAADAVLSGRVVAVQGLGGFQLVVDATDAEAVARLRTRKRRPDRPFALMFPTLDAVRQCCVAGEEEARQLLSPAAPILLLRRSAAALVVPASAGNAIDFRLKPGLRAPDEYVIAANVAPGNPYLGVMLPYTPLHHLLMDAIARPVVCTSGNLSEEPMPIDVDDALRRLGGVGWTSESVSSSSDGLGGPSYKSEPIADLLLVHNRPIVRPVDDSVARMGPDGLQVLRRARGFAPLPIMLDLAAPPLLATGGHLKNTVALAVGTENGDITHFPERPGGCFAEMGDVPVFSRGPTPVVLSQHIGDLESAASFDLLRRTIDDLLEFFALQPRAVACDLHPDYVSTRYAEELSGKFGVPLLRVQHHHAHVAACMAEHRLEGPVLGLSWDGAGYGADGTIWGGEALVCQGTDFRRAAHLRTFPLPGGDLAARQPRRAALGLLYEIFGPAAFEHVGEWFTPAERRALGAMLARGVNCPRTSSMGRLFDAMAALCGRWQEISFEGQAAMDLEFAADAELGESYELPLVVGRTSESVVRWTSDSVHTKPDGPGGPSYIADWEPMVRAILADRGKGESMGRVAARFHNALARLAVETAAAVGCERIALTGGCFQNALLQELAVAGLRKAGHAVYTHRQVPPGDGGIALGQIFVAAHSLRRSAS